MEKHVRFLTQIALFSILFLVLIMTINYLIEPYGIFRTDFSNQKIEPNQNFIKMKYIVRNPDRFDSFIFGSSRVGKIDGTKIEGGPYYNMTYSEGVPREHLNNIKIMLDSGVKIRNLLIGLDDFSYKVDPDIHFEQKMRHPYIQPEFRYYFRHLFNWPSWFDIRVAFFEEEPYFPTFYDFYETGMPIVQGIEEHIGRNVQAHIDDPKFTYPTHYSGDRIAETIEEIKEIVDIAEREDINLIFFINPIHHVTYLDADPEQFSDFKRELVKWTNFYDFSGLNRITTNNVNYYETSHYRISVADNIIYRIFKGFPEDFGVYVTPDNIDQHLENLQRELEEYLAEPLINE